MMLRFGIGKPRNVETGCTCGLLEKFANIAGYPVHFDADTNSYEFVWDTGHGEARLPIYFCPSCGGRAPERRRDSRFTLITDEEDARLTEIMGPLKTVTDVKARLGEPDMFFPKGETIEWPEAPSGRLQRQSYPVMLYSKLSETADVRIRIYPDEQIGYVLIQKFLGSSDRSGA